MSSETTITCDWCGSKSSKPQDMRQNVIISIVDARKFDLCIPCVDAVKQLATSRGAEE